MDRQRGTWVSAIAIAAATNMLVPEAFAACQANVTTAGVGLPTISATEASTAQALEVLERRRDEAVQSVSLTSADAAVAAADAAEPAPAAAASGSAGKKAAYKSGKAKGPVYKAPKAPTEGPDDAAPTGYGSTSARNGGWTRGVWASGYLDYERDDDVNIGLRDTNPNNATGPLSKDDVTVERKTRSGGALAGADWTNISPAGNGYMVGVLAGFNESRSKYSDGLFSAFIREVVNPDQFEEEQFLRTNARDEVGGGTVGGYGALFHGKTTIDLALKADINNLEHSHTTIKQNCANEVAFKRGDVDYVDYTVASNISHRYEVSRTGWLEPFVGFRYSYTDYSSASGNVDLGEQNGQILRIQGGARVSNVWVAPGGSIWTTSLTGALYSNVWMDGFLGKVAVGTDDNPPNDVPTDFVKNGTLNEEGKLRALGQLTTVVALGDGLSLIGQVEARGGDDYVGVGGLLGARYEW